MHVNRIFAKYKTYVIIPSEVKYMLFIEYPKCSTCKKAKKWLEDNNILFTDRNIISDIPTMFEIRKWMELSGLDVRKFFNAHGVKYKELNLKENLDKMSTDEQIRLLSSDAMLFKRPILVTDKEVLVGFKEKEWELKIK